MKSKESVTKLLPCPFCGEKGEYHAVNPSWGFVRCSSDYCRCEGKSGWLDDAILYWNRRNPPEVPQANNKATIQGSDLNPQKSLGVSEPSLVQENERLKKLQGEMNETLRNAMSSPKIPTMREQELDVKNFDQRMEIDSLTARLRLSEDRVKKYEEALEWLAYNIMELAKVKNKENFFVSKWRSYGCQEWGRDTVADGNTPLKAVQNAMALESQSLPKDEEAGKP